MRNRIYKILSVFVLIISLFTVNFVNKKIEAAESASKLIWKINTNEKNQDGTERLTYPSGMPIPLGFSINFSEARKDENSEYPGAKMTIKIPKKSVRGIPLEGISFQDASIVKTQLRNDTDDHYVMEYTFSDNPSDTNVNGQSVFGINGATIGTWRGEFRFPNFVTQDGDSATVEWILTDKNGNEVRKDTKTLTASAAGAWDSSKYIYAGGNFNNHHLQYFDEGNHTQDGQRVVQKYYYDVPVPSRTRPNEYFLDYQVLAAYIPVDRNGNFGIYSAVNTITFKDYLPQGASLAQKSIDEGWVYDAATHSASKKVDIQNNQLDTLWHGHQFLANRSGKWDQIRLVFNDQTLAELANKPGWFRTQRFTNKMEVIIDEGLPTQLVVDQKQASHVFESHSIPKVTPVGEVYSGTVDHNTTGHINYVYNGETHKITHENATLNELADQYGIKYHTSVWNDGANGGIIVGSLINKIKWRGLSNNMYFNAINIVGSRWGQNQGHVAEQMKTSQNKLYGVLPDGSREEIFSDLRIGSDRYYNIADRTRKYVELELEFTDPLYLERNDIRFDVFTKPTAEEADKFKNFEYDGDQAYHLQTEVNHTHTIPNKVVVTKEGATWRISEGSLPAGANFDASTGKVTLPYDAISDRAVRTMATSAASVNAYPNYSVKGNTFSTPSIGFNSNFDTLITIPENRATQLDIVFTDKNATEQSVRLVKDGNGDWSQQVGVDLPEGFTIDNSTKTIRILRSKQEADTQVEAVFLPHGSSYRAYARTPKVDGTQARPTIVVSKKDDTAKTLELVPNANDTASYEIQFTPANFRDRMLGTTDWDLHEQHGHENRDMIEIPKMRAFLEIGNENHGFYLNNSTQSYRSAGNLVDLHVGSSTFGRWTSADFESSMKLITLLPSGVDFVEDLGVIRLNNNGATDIKPAEVEHNFKGTGRTAVIYDYKHIKKVTQGWSWPENFVNFKFRVNMTLKQQEGPKQVDYWLVWDKDSIVRPYQFADKDMLDLDNDGNTEEQFIHRTSSLELYLPSEVTASKGVSIDKENFVTSAPAQDLGKDVFYRINVNNSSEFGLKYFEIIDVLPYVGDFNIVSNDAGTHPKRGTQFSTPLVKALEDIPENAKYLTKWDIFYSEDNQGTTEQTANANWKTKDEVDLSKVKLIKIKLKDGETFDSRTKIDFIINSKIPYDTNLENFSIAYNSFAMKTSENGNFVEANIVSATNVKYEVDGVLFFDTNRNTVKDENEPVVSNYKVYLVDENGQQVNDIEGNPIMATTDENGYYHMNVYSRGNYYVKVAKNYADEEFSDVYKIDTTNEFGQPIKVAKPGTTVAEDGLVGNDAIEDNGSGKTPLFTLNPAIRKATRNAGFVPSRGEIRVVKKDEEGKLLENVTFELFKDGNSLGRVKTNDKGEISFGNLEFGEYKLMEIETLTEYLLDSTSIDITVSKTDPIITKNIVNNFKRGTISLLKHDLDSSLPLAGVVFELLNQNNEVVQTQSTAANGILLFENVKYGDYIVREKETLVTHILDNTTQYPVSIRNNNETVHVLSDNKAITNEAKKGTVVIKKVDAETGAPLKGVIFALKQGNAVRNTAITNEDGIAQFIDVLYGKYDVVETKPLDNYIMPENPKVAEVTITDHRQSVDLNTVTNQIKKGHVEFKKVDAESNVAIAGVTFTLNQNGEEKYTAISNDQGVVRFENVIYGDYTLVEKATVENYNLSSETRNVAVRENGVTVTLENFTNQIKKGHVEFKKVDAESNVAIAGVTFTLNQNGEEKYTAISNDQGVVRFENVIYGDYTLVEKATVENYNLSSETRTVAVRENGVTVTLENFTNQIKKGHVEFKKVDAESNVAIAGVTFTLNQNGEEKYTAISNDQGVVRFENVIYGDYTLVEKATVENYNLSSETRNVAVRENGATVTLENFTNQIKKGHVEFVKVDSINSDKKLAGVTFTLSQNGTEKYRATSDINGVVRFEDVIYGDYELAEVETLENYLLSDVLTGVMIRENGVTINLGNYPNQEIRGNIVFKKVDSETQENIANAKFTLTGVDGTKVEAISDENGEVHFKGIPYGVYEIEESEAATGYVKSDKKLVAVIKEDGELVELENYENTKIKGSIVIKKVDADSKEVLAGVEFGIYQNGVLLQQGVTDSLGLISFENMVYGEYTVKEIKALAGYDKTEQEYVVKVEKDKEVVEVMIENHKTKVKPIIDTSDAGSAGLWFISLLSLVGFLFFARKKSQ